MLAFASPAWLIAGLAALVVPLVLHLIAPRPPARAPLPTARFLEPRSRMRRQIARRPRDLPLLLLRCAFLLLLFGALAGPRLVPARAGTADLVLVDPAAAADSLALGAARSRAGDDAIFVAAEPDFASTLASLPSLALRATRADSVRAWWVTPLHWRGWTPGTATLRRDAWPAAIGLIEATAPTDHATTDGVARVVHVVFPDSAAPFLRTALEALGFTARVSLSLDDADGPHDAIVSADAGVDSARIATLAQAGGTVVIAASGNASTRILVAGDLLLRDAIGSTVDAIGDERPVAFWADGEAAAVARAAGAGCIVRTGIGLVAPPLTGSPALPGLLRHLLAACDDVDPAATLPLGSVARATLAGGDTPGAVAVAALPGAGDAGMPLSRWLLLAALAVALIETWITGRRDRGTSRRPAGTSRT